MPNYLLFFQVKRNLKRILNQRTIHPTMKMMIHKTIKKQPLKILPQKRKNLHQNRQSLKMTKMETMMTMRRKKMNKMTKNLKLVKSLIARVVMVMMLKNVIKKMQLKTKPIKTKRTSKNSKKPKLWTLTKIHKAALKTRLKK